MLVKEEICAWFKEQSSAKRIDSMCGLLHMCLPMEKRFLGLFLEDLCRADYTSLRAEENKSNSINEVKKLSHEIKDPLNRSRIILTLCLMYSTNNACSQIMFDLLTSIHQLLQTCNKNELDRAIMDDIVTLFTMGIHHPAFTFSQKYDLYDRLQFVESYVSSVTKQTQESEDNSLKNDSSCSQSASTSVSFQSSQSNSQPKIVHIQDIELIKGPSCQTTEKRPLFKVHVSWSDGTKGELFKTYQDFSVFHSELIKLFPKDSGAHKQERHIPFLPQDKGHTVEEMQQTMRKYVRQLTSLPDYILQCDHMTQFFSCSEQPAPANQTPSSSATSHSHKKSQASPACFKVEREKVHGSGGQSSPGHIKSQIIYNSHLDVELTKKMAKHDSPVGQKVPKSPLVPVHSNNNNLPPPATRSIQQQMALVQSPMSSPLASPLSSPYISPASSQCGGSRSNSPTPFSINSWLRKIRLHKYSERFTKYSVQEFIQLKDEELEREGLTKGAQKRFRTEMDSMKALVKPGQNGCVMLDVALPISPMPHHQGYSSSSSSSSSSSCSSVGSLPGGGSGGQVPNKALFRHQPHLVSRGVGGLASREASPSLSDESSSPSDSPLPQDGSHLSRVTTENGIESKGKLHYYPGKLNINGDFHELNGHLGGYPGLPQNGSHMTLHNMSAVASMVRPLVTYAMPPTHPGMLLHRPPHFYRSPRSPVIRPDGTPGFMAPRLSNGVVNLPPPPPPNQGNNAPNNNGGGHVMGIPVSLQQHHHHHQQPPSQCSVSEVVTVTAISSSSMSSTVSCNGSCHSQGTMTMPLIAAAAPGSYPMTGILSSGTSSPLAHDGVVVTRPSTLDVQPPQSSHMLQENGPPSSSASLPETGLKLQQLEGSPVVPGVITLTPDINTASVFQTGSSLPSTTVTYTTLATSGYHSVPSPIMSSATSSLSSSSSATAIGGPTLVPGEPQTQPGINLCTANGNLPPHVMSSNSVQQQTHPSASNSPGSDCSQCASSMQQQPQQQQQQQPPIPPPPNTALHQGYSLPHQMWQHHPPLFSPYLPPPLTPGSNGLVTPPPPQHPSYIQSYMAPPPTPNGFSQPELFLQQQQQHTNHQHILNLMSQAAMAHPHHPHHHHQMLACAAAHLQHGGSSYSHGGGGGYMNHSHNGGGGGSKGSKKIYCYNCGQAGHKSFDCSEPTMESMTNPGTYHLNMKPKESSE